MRSACRSLFPVLRGPTEPAVVARLSGLRAVRLCRSLEPTVIIAMVAVHVVQVIAHEIVDVPGMRDAFMTACRTMHVSCVMPGAAVIGCALRSVRARGLDRVLVGVIVVRVMQVAVVQVIRVAVVIAAQSHHQVPAGKAWSWLASIPPHFFGRRPGPRSPEGEPTSRM
jgi:hypothetical protein